MTRLFFDHKINESWRIALQHIRNIYGYLWQIIEKSLINTVMRLFTNTYKLIQDGMLSVIKKHLSVLTEKCFSCEMIYPFCANKKNKAQHSKCLSIEEQIITLSTKIIPFFNVHLNIVSRFFGKNLKKRHVFLGTAILQRLYPQEINLIGVTKNV